MARFALAVGSCLAALLFSSSAGASAFHVGTQDARATAMGMAVAADVDDASAILYNPAGLAQGGKRLELRVGDTVVVPQFRETIAGVTTETADKAAFPLHAYLAVGFTEDAAVGVGFFTPFGLEVNWPAGWPGRLVSTRSMLRANYINPEVAYRFFGRIRIGAGVQIVRGSVDLRRQKLIPVPSLGEVEVGLDLTGVAWGVGGNVGLQVDLLDKGSRFGQLTLGAAWRSQVGLNFDEGLAHFSGVPAPLAPLLPDQRVSTSVDLPQILTLGAAWHFRGLRLDVDTEYTGWQSVRSIDLAFENPAQDTSIVKGFRHTWNLHVGGECAITENWLVRLGFMYDPTPSPRELLTPDLPDADRVNFAGGFGFRWAGLRVDLGYQYVLLLGKNSTFPLLPGKMEGNAQVAGLTLAYVFKL